MIRRNNFEIVTCWSLTTTFKLAWVSWASKKKTVGTDGRLPPKPCRGTTGETTPRKQNCQRAHGALPTPPDLHERLRITTAPSFPNCAVRGDAMKTFAEDGADTVFEAEARSCKESGEPSDACWVGHFG